MTETRRFQIIGSGAIRTTEGEQMKIKLLVDLPIEKKHGATKGRVFDVIAPFEHGRDRRYFFIGDTGERCAAYRYESEIIDGGE